MVGLVVFGIWLIHLQVVIGGNYGTDPPIVELPLGKAAGVRIETEDGPYMAYRGIPYAKPPIGKRRFAPPEFYDRPWSGVRNFSEYKDGCMGLNHLSNYTDVNGKIGIRNYTVLGSEDCLYLNIHKGYKLQKSAPVVFFIHGGFFSYSDPQMYRPDYLASQNIIYVNFAYRVGPLGFLSLGTDEFSGNMGLKDQVLALNWVKVNIWRFGGNTGRITVAGIDAGAASAHFLFFSRSSNEMFNNAISYSGTAISPWAFLNENTMLSRLFVLAEQLKCDLTGVMECFRSKSAKDLVLAQMTLKSFYYLPLALFPPVDDSTYLHGYFLGNPTEMMQKGTQKTNAWMTGFTKEDGLYPLAEFAAVDESIDVVLDRWNEITADLFFYDQKCDLGDELKRRGYAPDKTIGNPVGKYKNLLSLVSDRYYRAPAFYSAKKMSERNVGNTFLYFYDHPSEFSWAGVFVKDPLDQHPFARYSSHGDDVVNIFASPFYGSGLHNQDYLVHKLLIEIMVSFAATSYPPERLNWKPVDKYEPTMFREASKDAMKYVPLERDPKDAEIEIYFNRTNCKLEKLYIHY